MDISELKNGLVVRQRGSIEKLIAGFDEINQVWELYTFHEWYSPYDDRMPALIINTDGTLEEAVIDEDEVDDSVVVGTIADIFSTGHIAEDEVDDEAIVS